MKHASMYSLALLERELQKEKKVVDWNRLTEDGKGMYMLIP